MQSRMVQSILKDRHKTTFMIYIIQLVVPALFLVEFPWFKAVVGGVLIIVLALAYSQSAKPSIARYAIVIEIAILMVMVDYLYPTYIWLIFYPAAGIGLNARNVRQLISRLAVMVGLVAAECAWIAYNHPDQVGIIGPMMLVAFFGSASTGLGCLWQQKMRQSQSALEQANAEIKRLTIFAERERISQDLHDVMGHELSMITLKSQLAERLVDRDPERAKHEIRDMQQAARGALRQVREYIAGIRQPQLDEEWTAASSLFRAAGIEFDAVPMDLWPHSPDTASHDSSALQALAMCIRETCTNIVRHSGATRVSMNGVRTLSTCSIIIADNGSGMSVSSPCLRNLRVDQAGETVHPGRNTGIGMANMVARMNAVAGTMEVWSRGEPLTDVTGWPPDQVAEMDGLVIRFTVPMSSLPDIERGALG